MGLSKRFWLVDREGGTGAASEISAGEVRDSVGGEIG